MTDLPTCVLDREFTARRELVWRAWTDPELLPRWYGPGAKTIVHRLDGGASRVIRPVARGRPGPGR